MQESPPLALIIMFKLPGNYQLSVKSSQGCESPSDEGRPRSAAAPPSTKEQHLGAFDPDPSHFPCKPHRHCRQ